jgi:hypothetical protein
VTLQHLFTACLLSGDYAIRSALKRAGEFGFIMIHVSCSGYCHRKGHSARQVEFNTDLHQEVSNNPQRTIERGFSNVEGNTVMAQSAYEVHDLITSLNPIPEALFCCKASPARSLALCYPFACNLYSFQL